MKITSTHCDFAFAVARNARHEGLTLEQMQDLIKAAYAVLEYNDARVDVLDRRASKANASRSEP